MPAMCEECKISIPLTDSLCNKCEREKIFLQLLEGFSDVIHRHLPRFDNNIKEETWKLLEVFAEETIEQLR